MPHSLALTTMAMNGIGMGLAVTFVLICSNVIISALRKVIPNEVRIPAFVLIIATFVTMVRLALDYAMPDLYESLGLYLPLIVVNCIILARAESFASKNGVLASACDGLFMGLGFTLALTLMGAFREILGSGKSSDTDFGIFLSTFLRRARARSSRSRCLSRRLTPCRKKSNATKSSKLINRCLRQTLPKKPQRKRPPGKKKTER